MFYVAVWKFYYKPMHNDLPLYFFAMKPTLPTVCKRYEIRAPMFHLPLIRHTFAEHSIRYYLINLLNKDTRSTSIIERIDTDQGWGQIQLTKYSSTPSTPNIYQVQVLVKYSFFKNVLKYIKYFHIKYKYKYSY